MKKKRKWDFLKAILVIALVSAFVLPGSAIDISNEKTMNKNISSNYRSTQTLGESRIYVEETSEIVDARDVSWYYNSLTRMKNKFEYSRIINNNVQKSMSVKIVPKVITTIYVDDDNTAGPWDGTIEHPYQYIQDGIDNASDGDTVFVYEGIYYEYVVVNKAIDLIGEDRHFTIIDGGEGYGHCISVNADGVNIKKFYLRNGNCGIYLRSSTGSTIELCSSIDNYHAGIYLRWSEDCTISNSWCSNSQIGLLLEDSPDNSILNFYSYNNIVGVWVAFSSNCDIMNCAFTYNHEFGIYIEASLNCNLSHCIARNNNLCGIGIFCYSDNNSISNCEVYNNHIGIGIVKSAYAKLRDNMIYGNTYNLDIESRYSSGDLIHFYHDIDTSNTINDRPIYYLIGQNDMIFDETYNIGFIGFVSCTNMTVKNLDVCGIVLANTGDSTIFNVSSRNSEKGIIFFSSSNNDISYCNFYENWYGIHLFESCNNVITNCNLYNNYKGIQLQDSSNYNNITNCNSYNNYYDGICVTYYSHSNNITNCNFYNNDKNGIYLHYESYNSNVINCNCYNNNYGLTLLDSSNNKITNCDVYNNSDTGIRVNVRSNGNKIHHNNFINNAVESATDSGSNTWYSYLPGGNYWSNFDEPAEGAWDNDSDGIVDSPYNIPHGDNQDLYPFMYPNGWNTPPETPAKPTGPPLPLKWTNKTYIFITDTTDLEGDQVQYGWDWNGNGTVDEWTGFYESGESANASHLWIFSGTYYVKVKARDIYSAESDWSEPLKVRVFEAPRKIFLTLAPPI